MIDYEKLKLAHELVYNYQERHNVEVMIGVNITPSIDEYILHIEDEVEDTYSSLDELIVTLRNLLYPKVRFKIGDEAWRLNENHQPQLFVVEEFDPDGRERYTLNDNEGWYEEHELFLSLASLAEYQMAYWSKIYESSHPGTFVLCKQNYIPDSHCAHETDALVYPTMPPQNKCTKCGEFYI